MGNKIKKKYAIKQIKNTPQNNTVIDFRKELF